MARPAKRPAKKREAAGPTLAQRIVAAPLLSSPADARAKVSAWLGEIAASEAGRALARLPAGSNKLQALIEGVADGSPFLWELAAGEPARLVALLESDPDAHLDALLGAAAAPHEGRGRAPDRAVRHRRCLAGDARHGGADAGGGCGDGRRGALCPE